MKALTLTEPYATLVAYRWKAYETRKWRTDHRGPLAIHAAKGFGGFKDGRRGFERVLRDLHPGLQVLLAEVTGRTDDPATWPLGKIVAVTWVEDCIPTGELRDELRESDEELGWWESEVGDYSDGRWAWELRDPILVTPIPYRGTQGLWTLPDDVIPENVRRANAVPA